MIYGSCEEFFADDEASQKIVLEEYCHVIEQWNKKRMGRRSYLWELMRHGYNNSKYEKEAKNWATKNFDAYKACLTK